jgi:hypothetical protein
MRLMSRSITSAAVMYALASSSASAQAAHPNYSGTWVLDSSKSASNSAMGDAPQIASATWVIAQHGDTIVMDRETAVSGQPVAKAHIMVATDGKPWKNTVQQGGSDIETSSIGSWVNGELVISTSGNIQGFDFVQTDRWTLSADGQSLVSRRSVTVTDQGEVQSATLTFTKKS